MTLVSSSEKFHTIAPFLRGYSPTVVNGPYDPLRIADDLVDLANAVSPREPVFVVGHDWGAVATYAALARRPDRFVAAVTLAVPHPLQVVRNVTRHPVQLRRSWYMLFFQLPWISERVAAARDFALVERLWRDWSPGWTPPPEHVLELKECLRASWPAPIRYYRDAARMKWKHPKIRVPVLHLQGAQDGCVGAEMGEGQERWFEGPFESKTIPGAGHWLHMERPDVVASEIAAWFRRFSEASAPGHRRDAS
jgi:pimeloyl-ACP methyl ester carboxylesterase